MKNKRIWLISIVAFVVLFVIAFILRQVNSYSEEMMDTIHIQWNTKVPLI